MVTFITINNKSKLNAIAHKRDISSWDDRHTIVLLQYKVSLRKILMTSKNGVVSRGESGHKRIKEIYSSTASQS